MKEFAERLKQLRSEKELSLDMVVYDLDKKYHLEITKGICHAGKMTKTIRPSVTWHT